MKAVFFKLKDKFRRRDDEEDFDFSEDVVEEEGYVELNSAPKKDIDSKILVRPYVLEDFSDVKPVLDSLREGYTICLLNIKPLKEKDIVELKRAINKLKKTCDAVDGDIAGFGEDWIVVAPSFVDIYREKKAAASASRSTDFGEDDF